MDSSFRFIVWTHHSGILDHKYLLELHKTLLCFLAYPVPKVTIPGKKCLNIIFRLCTINFYWKKLCILNFSLGCYSAQHVAQHGTWYVISRISALPISWRWLLYLLSFILVSLGGWHGVKKIPCACIPRQIETSKTSFG